jgi:hypothetical protein
MVLIVPYRMIGGRISVVTSWLPVIVLTHVSCVVIIPLLQEFICFALYFYRLMRSVPLWPIIPHRLHIPMNPIGNNAMLSIDSSISFWIIRYLEWILSFGRLKVISILINLPHKIDSGCIVIWYVAKDKWIMMPIPSQKMRERKSI